MRCKNQPLPFQKLRLIVLPAILSACLGFLLSNDSSRTKVQAFSAGPPPGYTGAPLEEPEACAECHVPPDAGSGHISISAPTTYIPGQTYSITVTHTNADQTRLRWGFELTVLDSSDEKAGELQPLDGLTQIINNAGPGGTRQYIEHTSIGTFVGQHNGASWTFNWVAPPIDVGPVTFYTAGNQANNDGNTSGDNIYKTLVTSSPQSATPDFAITATPAARTTVPGGSAQYTVTITPFAGFTGVVNLNANGLPSGASAVFNPTSVNITDANAKTTTLTINTGVGTPVSNSAVGIEGQSGSLVHSSQVNLQVVSPSSLDLSTTQSASPNPGEVGSNLVYRILVFNNGPAAATNVTLIDTLPGGVTLGTVTTTQGACTPNGNTSVNCALGSLSAGTTAIVTTTTVPASQGQITNTAVVSSSETDFDSSNNSSSITTTIFPAAPSPVMLDDNLTVSTVVSGLNQPTSMAFIGTNDFLVLERTTGKVQRIINGALQSTVLDLAVNGASERGLLGIALHPLFAQNGFVYLYWTETISGVDTLNIDDIPLLGNRVDRFIWNGATLSFDRNLIKLRSLQMDAGQPSRGNHDGGVLRFGLDGKLYVIFGDNGRRGFLQNLATGGPVPDDQFGGPDPDNAHLTGVILRLNDDGTTPPDNPFFNATTTLTGEAAANIKKVFAYGVRNSFGMAFDPLTGNLWTEENGDDTFDELNRVIPGFNGGWVQVIGPLARIDEFKSIEMTYGAGNLQQLRWPPSNIANTPQEAVTRLFNLPGSQYVDPEFSWKYAVAPSPIGFIRGRGLGAKFEGDMLVGASRTTLLNGYLYRFRFTPDRQHFAFTDPRLNDRVADNVDKFDQTESESLAIGRDFGITTDITTGPNGNVFVVSLSNGAVYEIKSKPSLLFVANLDGAHEVPPNSSNATGTATLLLSPDETTARVSLHFGGLSSAQTDAHIHGPGAVGVTAPVLFPLPLGQVNDFEISLTPAQAQDLKNGLWYVNVHSSNLMNGEIRGQFLTSASASSVQLNATKYTGGENQGSVTFTVTRLGSTTGTTTVDYTTGDGAGTNPCNVVNGQASSRCDYETTLGTLTFAPGETSKTILVPIVDDGYVEGSENLTLTLSNATGATLGAPSTATLTITDNDSVSPTNPIDTTSYFVRQHYIDFLSREPDPPGFGFWTTDIDNCTPKPQCTEVKRINVSGAFFLSIEFQETGYLVYRMYKTSFGNLNGAPVPVTFTPFLRDTQRVGQGVIVGVGPWEAQLEANKQAFALAFVQRPEFQAAFPNGMSASAFVDQLNTNAGGVLSPTERNNLIAMLTNANDVGQRAQVLRAVAEDQDLKNAEFNKAFVLMQYFGYLRRNPNDAPDSDFSGFNFWLGKLNDFNGNFINAEMAKAFINSLEYRQRFGP
ncbi:MAG TPA: PQQ-dependent sugar dehydrogenase [Pyrinomonadaceae bacterium]